LHTTALFRTRLRKNGARILSARRAERGQVGHGPLHLPRDPFAIDVRVPVSRHGEHTMAEDALHDLEIHAHLAQPRPGRMPQGVEVDHVALGVHRRQTSGLQIVTDHLGRISRGREGGGVWSFQGEVIA